MDVVRGTRRAKLEDHYNIMGCKKMSTLIIKVGNKSTITACLIATKMMKIRDTCTHIPFKVHTTQSHTTTLNEHTHTHTVQSSYDTTLNEHY